MNTEEREQVVDEFLGGLRTKLLSLDNPQLTTHNCNKYAYYNGLPQKSVFLGSSMVIHFEGGSDDLLFEKLRDK